MPIVGGLDIHQKQITFDYLDLESSGPGSRSPGRAWANPGAAVAWSSLRSRSAGPVASGPRVYQPKRWLRPAAIIVLGGECPASDGAVSTLPAGAGHHVGPVSSMHRIR